VQATDIRASKSIEERKAARDLMAKFYPDVIGPDVKNKAGSVQK